LSAGEHITERKRAEQELRWRTAFFEAQVHSAVDGILVVDSQGKKIVQNHRMTDLWKIPPHIAEDPEDAKQVQFVLGRVKDPQRFGERIAYLYAHPNETSVDEIELVDGTVLDRHSAAVRGTDGMHYGRVWTFRDITERKRAESLLLGQKLVLEMIACDAPMKDILRTLLEAIEGQNDEMLCSILLLDADGLHLRHGAAPRLPEAYTEAIDGVAIGANVGSCGTAAFRGEQVVVEDIATDPLWENYSAMALPHGLRACWSTPILDAERKVLGTFAVYYRQPCLPGVRDRELIATATHTAAIAIGRERAKAALRASELQLRQSQKLEAIGQLAGGVAHDYNNILASTLMQLDLIRGEGGLSVTVKEGLEQIRADAERAANLTRQLLLFSRRQTMQPRTLDLNEQVLHLVKMLQRIIGEDVRLELHLHSAPLLTHADAGMLDQVLMNLVVNARDAMPEGGRLRIETTTKTVTAPEAQLQPEAAQRHFVCLKVSDTGAGIPPEIVPRIFEPFFTTKPQGKGTGLGLATVYGILKQHQGWIQLDNHPGQGVTFETFLPAGAAAAETPPGDTQSQARRGTETILVVEDEPGLLKLLRKVLELHGYRVLTATNGPEAIHQWEDHRASVAVLLTDLVMPGGMSGQKLARRLQSERAQLKVIYSSGYSADIAGREFQLLPGEAFVQKPFTTEQILQVVRETLDG